jgi:hypothetical protein
MKSARRSASSFIVNTAAFGMMSSRGTHAVYTTGPAARNAGQAPGA